MEVCASQENSLVWLTVPGNKGLNPSSQDLGTKRMCLLLMECRALSGLGWDLSGVTRALLSRLPVRLGLLPDAFTQGVCSPLPPHPGALAYVLLAELLCSRKSVQTAVPAWALI